MSLIKRMIRQQYEKQIETIGEQREKLLKKAAFLPLLRFSLFLLSLIFLYRYLVVRDILYLTLAPISLILFGVITWWDNRLKKEVGRCDRLVEICTNEIKSINGDYSPFDPGAAFIDPDHNYTYDLDLFGKNSLYQCINRSVTIFGKNRLADDLKNAYHFRDQIQNRQDAIGELSRKQAFCQQLQLVFYGQKSDEKDRLEFIEWLESGNAFPDGRWFTALRYGSPFLTATMIVLASMGLVVIHLPIMMFLLQLIIVSFFARSTLRAQALLTSKVETITKYAQFLQLIENTNFQSALLNDLKLQLSFHGSEKPSKVIARLSRLLNWLDTNLNIIASVLLNGLLLFNLHLLKAIGHWKVTYREVIPGWFDVMGELDALASLANFARNNPEYIFPKPVTGGFRLDAYDLGHPLIAKDECVTNSISITGWQQFGIITGANMSGKSTFLRTVGTNYVLAMVGAPVFASSFIFSPIMLHSSIRTNDSLAKKESFFYAELKRLKSIITELQNGQHIFILLDEILKGTNSKDKQEGSIALLKQLINYDSVGLIATHDLILGDLIVNYPDNIRNMCFEIQIIDDQLVIDYRLHEGISKNLNATFLMKKMGILMNPGG